MSNQFDIVIIGAGPVGLTLAAAITRMGPYKIKIIDKRAEPTKIGRAAGIQGRTLDFLENMSLKPQIMAYGPGRVYEVAFWNPSETGEGIQRTANWQSYPDFIDTRHHFSTILHQGRIEKILIDDIAQSSIQVDRPCTISSFRVDEIDKTYPVEVEIAYAGRVSTVRAKYLFGADGAKSFVREKLGIPMPLRDPITFVWGVIDGQVKTTFPDINVGPNSSRILPWGAHNPLRSNAPFTQNQDQLWSSRRVTTGLGFTFKCAWMIRTKIPGKRPTRMTHRCLQTKSSARTPSNGRKWIGGRCIQLDKGLRNITLWTIVYSLEAMLVTLIA
jgi:2-polyprenyl-6-methoxyphenol hydroxylase-like FAD-dependent oxidoreductase